MIEQVTSTLLVSLKMGNKDPRAPAVAREHVDEISEARRTRVVPLSPLLHGVLLPARETAVVKEQKHRSWIEHGYVPR